MSKYTIRHGPRRHFLRPWRLDCLCGFEAFPCAAVRLGVARVATVWTRWVW